MALVQLVPLTQSDREQFITDNQEAFNYGALEELGKRNERFEEKEQIISRNTIEKCIDEGTAYRIVENGKIVGGAVIKTEYDYGELELLFVSPSVHSRGIGFAAWQCIEDMHPEIALWESFTPYFEKRNIHFYVNRCGFHIVEFYNERNRDPHDEDDEVFEMFRFEKVMPVTAEALREQIKRITYYEKIMQKAEQSDASSDELEELSDYYGSAAWKRDFSADEAGLLPADLKRGVLSEDGLYDLLENNI